MLPLLLVTTAVLGSLQERRPVVQPPTLRLGGEVRDVDEEADLPLAGRRLRLAFFLDGETIDAHEVRTDAEGRFQLHWQPPERWLRAGEGVERGWTAHVMEEGLQRHAGIRRWSGAALPPAHDRVLWIGAIELRSGWSREVEVVDRAGHRVEDPLLDVIPRIAPEGPYLEAEIDYGPGWDHALVHVEPGVDTVLVQATAEGRGAGWTRVERDGSEPFRIVLQGTGVLTGTLVDPLGVPVSGFEVIARAEAFLEELADEAYSLEEELLRRVPPEGLREARAVTDRRGRFRMEGLAAGRFVLQLSRWSRSERGVQIEPLSCLAGGAPVLVVVPLHRVELEVPRGARASCLQLDPFPRSEWDRCTPFDPGAEPGHFMLRAGATHAVGLWSPSRGLVEERVVAGAGGAFLQRLAIALPSPADPGAVDVTVRCEDSSIAVYVQILAPLSRQVLLEERATRGQSGVGTTRLRLPEGRYLVRASEGDPSRTGSTPWSRFTLTESLQEVEVEPGGRTAARLELTPGGRLRLLVTAEGAEVALARCRGWGQADWRVLDFEPSVQGVVVGSLAHVQPGTRESSRYPLAPGRYELRVEAEGFAPTTVELEVAPGQVSVELDVVLERL